ADRRPATQARLAGAAVNPGIELEFAGRAFGIAEVAQRRAAEFDRARERLPDRGREPVGARPADAVAARARIDSCPEERLARIDVAGADDDLAAEQRALDRDAPAAQRGVQMRAVEAVVERLDAESGEERRCRRRVGRVGPDDRA